MAGVFIFCRFGERFRKTAFSRRILVGGRANRKNKAAFSNKKYIFKCSFLLQAGMCTVHGSIPPYSQISEMKH